MAGIVYDAIKCEEHEAENYDKDLHGSYSVVLLKFLPWISTQHLLLLYLFGSDLFDHFRKHDFIEEVVHAKVVYMRSY